MRILKIIVKAVLAALATVKLGGSSSLPEALIFFAAVYGLVSWYIFSFSEGGFFEAYSDDVGTGFIFTLLFNLCMPILVLVIPLFILEAILPGEIGTIIYGVCVCIACLACLIGDILYIIRLFKPDFLGGDVDVLSGD